MTENKPQSVEIDQISVRFGDVFPIRKLSLDIGAGELVSILGPSGCGKTTTLRAVAGFNHPFEGDIRIDGKSVIKIPANARDIGMMYQSYALFPHKTVAENVGFGLKMRGLPKGEIVARVREILGKFQLRQFEERLPGQLSGGQQQRVALARALVFNPRVLLLDEPLAALDKKLRSEMQFELKRIQREYQITTMFVSHDQEEALSLSDRVAVMANGKILQIDTPSEVYDRPTHRFVADFVGNANFLTGRVKEGEGRRCFELENPAVRIQLPEGDFPLGPAEMMIRPERLRLGAVGQDNGFTWRGKLRDRVFLGNGLRIMVELELGRTVQLDLSPEQDRGLADKSEVEIGCLYDDVRIFPLETASR